jgi:hypothetical protein
MLGVLPATSSLNAHRCTAHGRGFVENSLRLPLACHSEHLRYMTAEVLWSAMTLA